jgi:hypothetical protein
MPDNIEVAGLHARLEAIVKEAEAQAARLLLEESKAAVLEQTATAARQRVPSSSSSSSSPVGLAARPHRLFDLRRYGCRQTSPLGGRSAQRPSAGEHRPRLLHQLRQLA